MLYLNRQVRYEITADEYRREREQKISIIPVVAPGHAGAMVHAQF